MRCEMKERVLEYLKGDSQDPEVENHLEHCEQCQALMEGFLAGEESISLPEAEPAGGNLKEQVEHYEKGTRRILIFTIAGLVMGWFSYMYYNTDLLPLKLIIGLPYKLNEMIHVTLHNHSLIYLTQDTMARFNEFFPQAYFVSLAAEYGISTLIGGAVYGSIGFFTGDKRIFTLTKYLKFAAVWALIILLCIAGTFYANHVAVEKNQKFEDLSGFFLHHDTGGDGYYHDDTGERKRFFDALDEAFYADGTIKKSHRQRDFSGEELIEFVFGNWHSRHMAAYINLQRGYLVTDTGRMYSMSDEFCQMVAAYQEREEKTNEETTD